MEVKFIAAYISKFIFKYLASAATRKKVQHMLHILSPCERLNLSISYSISYTVKFYRKYRYPVFIKVNSLIYNLQVDGSIYI